MPSQPKVSLSLLEQHVVRTIEDVVAFRGKRDLREARAELMKVVDDTPLDLRMRNLGGEQTGIPIGDLSEAFGQMMEPLILPAHTDVRISLGITPRDEQKAKKLFTKFCHYLGFLLTTKKNLFAGSLNNLARFLDLTGKRDEIVVVFLRKKSVPDAMAEAQSLIKKFLGSNAPADRELVFVTSSNSVENHLTDYLASEKIQVVLQTPTTKTISELKPDQSLSQAGFINEDSIKRSTFHLLLHDGVVLPDNFMSEIDRKRYHLYLSIFTPSAPNTTNPLLIEIRDTPMGPNMLKNLADLYLSQA